MVDEAGELHLAVCRRFSEAVRAADGRWNRPTPCDAWDTRGVLEHVIGFHDVLVLRPLGLKPERPRDDPQTRWALTYEQLDRAFDVGLPPDARPLVPNLTRDVLVHTWDLARAVRADDRLDTNNVLERWRLVAFGDVGGVEGALGVDASAAVLGAGALS